MAWDHSTNDARFPLAAARQSLYNGAMPTRSKRRPTRRAKRASSSAGTSGSHHFLTNSEGQRRAIILDMNYYLKLLGELHTLRAQAKLRGPVGPARGGRRSSR